MQKQLVCNARLDEINHKMAIIDQCSLATYLQVASLRELQAGLLELSVVA